ncbi:MAG: zinc finger Ran-binding domain-containing protein, partial [archaeon]|nr:zinc finger Ran-binding domain-containing protein [archaeon]
TTHTTHNINRQMTSKYKPKRGDWKCPESHCGADNFASRKQCFKCHTNKPPGPKCPTCQEFYGTETTHWYCSTCFPAKFPEEAAQQQADREAIAQTKAAEPSIKAEPLTPAQLRDYELGWSNDYPSFYDPMFD